MRKRDAALLEEIESDAMGERPIAEALRKVVILGGRAGSASLRGWALSELKGYESEDELPEYRRLHAPICVDGVVWGGRVSGQVFSVYDFPEVAREGLRAGACMFQGIGEIEAMISANEVEGDEPVRLSVAGASLLAKLMNSESTDKTQQITAVYYAIHVSVLHGLVDRVRTALAELIATIRAATPEGQPFPSAGSVDSAVSVAIHGDHANVTVAAPSVAGNATISQRALVRVSPKAPWWRQWWSVGLGLVTIAGVVIAFLQWRQSA